ncbi:MAG: hypothetical protein A2X49_05425 [Lentisphaerae bacterium GWF2_52_8]|nr:MAG: hypothetical protein A2X49_05425 [Lentisphaerae bacterium GWF2_52_8]
MIVSQVYNILSILLAPLASPLFFLPLLLLLNFLNRRKTSLAAFLSWILTFTFVFGIAFFLVLRLPEAAKWISRLQSPLYVALTLIVLPSIFLPRNRFYFLFLIVPLFAILFAALEVYSQYNALPEGSGFAWLLMRPGFVLASVASVLVISQHFLSLDSFRKFCRVTALLLLLFGGFVFRQSYADWKEMLKRRSNSTADIMSITETVPVLRQDNRLTYLPAAPCRFSADGGYVQGCVMELAQRLMQIRQPLIASGDPGETALLSTALAALLSLAVLCYAGARWWCGWICPLSTIGELFNQLRKVSGLPYIKAPQPLKMGLFAWGNLSAAFGLALAYAYTKIDSQGRFMGCKIPLYPFCKICPGQQVCPIASKGLAGISPLPGFEWLFGFFRGGVVVLLLLFVLAFLCSRRLWCYFCPMGMAGGIFNKGALLSLKKNPGLCNGCGACNEVCPMDIHSVQQEMEKTDVSCFDCVYCLKCVDKCPQDGCLSLDFAGRTISSSNYTEKLKNG